MDFAPMRSSFKVGPNFLMGADYEAGGCWVRGTKCSFGFLPKAGLNARRGS